jgi:undecaprenyl-diphosphatase
VGLNLAHDLRGARLDRWMPALTWLGSLAVLLPVTALAALALCRGRNRRAAGFLMLALLGASALSHLVKLAVMRPRPDLLPVWTAMPTDWSYPSAHAMQITALAVAVVFVVARRRALWILPLGSAVLLVGLSRIYLQVHFPSDVLVGTLAAALWVGGLHALIFGRSSGYDSSHVDGGKG